MGFGFLDFCWASVFLLNFALDSFLNGHVQHDYGTIVQKGESCRGEYLRSRYSCNFVYFNGFIIRI